MLHAVVQFARTWILKRYNQETEAIRITQRHLSSTAVFFMSLSLVLIVSDSPHDYVDVFSSTLWKMYCTVQWYWADLTTPLTVTQHYSIPPRGWDDDDVWINMYKSDPLIWKYELCFNIMISNMLTHELFSYIENKYRCTQSHTL